MPENLNAELPGLLWRPRETLDIEIKQWLTLTIPADRADLCKAIIALANHGGGYIVIGLQESADGSFAPSPNRPADLSGWSQDTVQDAVQRFVDPPIQCRTEHVEHPEGHGTFPIIVVPGGHRVPVRAKRDSEGRLVINRVYIRRPGPRSEEPQTTAEWNELFENVLRARKDDLLAGIRDLLAGGAATAQPDEPQVVDRLNTFAEAARARWVQLVAGVPANASPRFPNGYYEAAIAIDGEHESPDLAQLQDTLQASLTDYSGWPPFVLIRRAWPNDGALEYWRGPDEQGNFASPAHSDFWRISCQGMFYTRRGYPEDGGYRGIQPGTAFDITTPTWRIAEVILRAHEGAVALGGQEANLVMQFKWTGLSNRKLVSVGNPNRLWFENDAYTAHQDSHATLHTTAVGSVPDALPEIVFSILKPLYALFGFWQLPKQLVEQEVTRLLRRQL